MRFRHTSSLATDLKLKASAMPRYFLSPADLCAMNQKEMVASLLAKANKYRNFARWVGDRQTVQSIFALTVELKKRARALASPDEDKIRKRAREIWEENGRPIGRDVEFWLAAEREFREAEALAKEIRDDDN
jgi:Protein of unknown function (DUF2934)